MRRVALAVGLAAAALLGPADVRGANPPGALDLPPSNVIPAPVDVTPTAPPSAERPADPTGNPLWAIPLSSLTATRERPIFLPSRRAPRPACAPASAGACGRTAAARPAVGSSDAGCAHGADPRRSAAASRSALIRDVAPR